MATGAESRERPLPLDASDVLVPELDLPEVELIDLERAEVLAAFAAAR